MCKNITTRNTKRIVSRSRSKSKSESVKYLTVVLAAYIYIQY